MNEFEDPQFLLSDQYKDSSNFAERMAVINRLSADVSDSYRWLFDALELPGGGDVLDIGCGPGYLWRHNLDRLADDWRVTLADFSPGMLEEARQNLQGKDSWRFEQADVQALPFQANAFDIVIANAMLYHVPDRQRAFSEIRRVLRPAGLFYATTIMDSCVAQIRSLSRYIMESEPAEFPSFSQSNAREQLSPWFGSIEERNLAINVLVTTPEPILGFFGSLLPRAQQNEQVLAAMRSRISQLLYEDGKIEWQLGIALFICSSLTTKEKGQ